MAYPVRTALLLAFFLGIVASAAYTPRAPISPAVKSPGKARGWNNLGYAYQQAGRFRDAESAYLRALRVDPGYALARGNLRGLKARSDSVR